MGQWDEDVEIVSIDNFQRILFFVNRVVVGGGGGVKRKLKEEREENMIIYLLKGDCEVMIVDIVQSRLQVIGFRVFVEEGVLGAGIFYLRYWGEGRVNDVYIMTWVDVVVGR